ncbi:hypothetical protein GCM10023200_56820 [Actinomycetospora chlora]|uniref:PhoD-like phosphatase metallophosphatase domain-containing protein n=1 Tax=Actinomycetospora chlora TaxID=663608 RepID=A0ABP9CLS1_9PSEU
MAVGLMDPVQRWLFRRGRSRSVHHGPGGKDMTPGVAVVQKDGAREALHLWIGAFRHGAPTDTLTAHVTVTDGATVVDERDVELSWFVVASECRVSGWDAGSRLFHRHVTIPVPAPDPDADLDVRVDVPGLEEPGTCRARVLRAGLPEGGSLRIVAGSCYDAYTDHGTGVGPGPGAAYAALFDGGPPRPDLVLLAGDQIYADTPWWAYLLQARATPRTNALLEYWASWGMQLRRDGLVRRGLHPLLTDGPTWFLPDDHEFWNNWPHASVTAKHSFLNQAKGLWGGLTRSVSAALALVREPRVVVPEDPGEVPRGAVERNLLPVHPDEWDRWSRASFDLIGSFQTRSVRDREQGIITRGEWGDDPADDPGRPPRGGPRGVVHQPLTPPVQVVELDPVHVVLLDTRTRRTRVRTDDRWSQFVDPACLDEVVAVAGRAAVLVLALPEPLLRRAEGWRPSVPGAGDVGIRHYVRQYEDFWARLRAARAGRPTVTIGGDIHRSYVAHSTEAGLVEVVASPSSLVYGSHTAWRVKYDAIPPPPGPLEGSPVPAHRDIALPGHPDHVDALAGLQIDRTGEHEYRLHVRLRPLNPADAAQDVTYVLRDAGGDPVRRET